MSKKVLAILIVLVVLAAGAGIYFKDAIFDAANGLKNFHTSDVGDILNQVKEQILTSSPLRIGGKANNVVLVASKIITETNLQRYNNGLLPTLKENEKLNAAAKAKADDMFKKQYFEHVSPSGVDPGTLVKNAGYEYIITGENLILGNFKDEKDVVQRWMDSPGHRANILNDRVIEIGVAVVKGVYKGETVWIGVQEFGLPLSSCPQPTANLKNAIDAGKKGLDALSLQLDQKKRELENTNQRSSQYNKLVDEYNVLVQQYNALAAKVKNLVAEYNAQINVFNQCVQGT